MCVARLRSARAYALPAALLLAALAAVSPAARPEEPAVWAITNARIFPVSSPVVEKGTIVIRNGVIEAVGASVTIPADARVLDAAGLTVYPGLIDALSDIGLEEARPETQAAARAPAQPAVPARPGAPAQQQPAAPPSEESRGLTPYRQAAELLSLTNRKIESARNAGITTTLVSPRTGFFPGQSSVINLTGGDVGRMVVRTPVAYHITLSQARGFGRGYPSSLMGVFAFVKQTLLDAQRYEAVWAQYRSTPGVPRPEYSRALEALQPLIQRRLPVVLYGNTPVEIERALALADSFKLDVILAGCMEAGPIASELRRRNIPVLLGVRYPEPPARDGDPEFKEELEALRRRVEAPGNAAALAKAGVRFAFVSDDMANPADFLRNVGRAVEAGLDRQAALRALTLTPAEILGIADRFGSIEKNKTANLVLATGDLFATGTRVKYVFVDGERFEIPETPAERPAGGPGAKPAAAAAALDVSGTWDLVINSPQGPMDVTLTVRQSGETLTGSLSSMMGESAIYQGTVAGNRISFRIAFEPPGMPSMEVLFTGTVQGTQITGTASVADMGSFDFTGSKRPGDY
jgi:imidazolonepropionase-like amidohydrolase